jgi:hypothetical protein
MHQELTFARGCDGPHLRTRHGTTVSDKGPATTVTVYPLPHDYQTLKPRHHTHSPPPARATVNPHTHTHTSQAGSFAGSSRSEASTSRSFGDSDAGGGGGGGGGDKGGSGGGGGAHLTWDDGEKQKFNEAQAATLALLGKLRTAPTAMARAQVERGGES